MGFTKLSVSMMLQFESTQKRYRRHATNCSHGLSEGPPTVESQRIEARPSATAVNSLLMRHSWSWLQSALHARVDRIERRRAADVHSVSLLAAEAQIGHRLRYMDLAN